MELVRFILNRKRQRVGVVVSNEYNSVGWSLCHVTREKFNRDRGLEIARAREAKGSGTPVPESIQEDVGAMLNRSQRYFGKNVEGSL